MYNNRQAHLEDKTYYNEEAQAFEILKKYIKWICYWFVLRRPI